MVKLVIFDLDGTIIDSVHDIKDNINIMLKKFGYPERSLEDIKQFIGNGARKLVARSLGAGVSEEKIDECLSYYNKIYTDCGSPKTVLFSGVGEVLKELSLRGYKLAILTNKPQITTDGVYETYLSEYNFSKVVGQSSSIKCKPDKSATLNIMNELNALPENTYFVGDGETDVLTAINSKTNGVAVLWGYRKKSQLVDAGATIFAEKPSDLLSILL